MGAPFDPFAACRSLACWLPFYHAPPASDDPVAAGGEGVERALLLRVLDGAGADRAHLRQRLRRGRAVPDEIGRQHYSRASLAHQAMHHHWRPLDAMTVYEAE